MGGRVVECARLESVLGLNNLRGFESLPIRHSGKSVDDPLNGTDVKFSGGEKWRRGRDLNPRYGLTRMTL